MNIVFVNSTRRWGGVKTWTLDFGAELMRQGHRIRIFGRPGPFIEKAQALKLDARPFSFGMDFSPMAIARFIQKFRKEPPDVVIANVSKDLRTAGIAARILNIPVVHRVGLPKDMANRLKNRLTHVLLKPQYLVPCSFIKEGLIKNLPYIHPEEVMVIPSAKKIAGGSPSIVNRPVHLVTTSQLNPDKGHLDAIQALAELKNQGFDFIWHVAGTGSIDEKLKEAAQEFGLSERTVWHGFVPDVPALLRQCDIFLLPSHREGLPNTLLEALAEGLVPVAFDVGGIPEAWPSGLMPFLVQKGQSQNGLAKALKLVLSGKDPDILHWRKLSLDWAKANFDIEKNSQLLQTWITTIVPPEIKA